MTETTTATEVTQGTGGRSGKAAPTTRKPKAQAQAKAPEVHVKEVTVRQCQCGCGATTKGRFAMGHDAKLKSRLINDALEFESANKGRKSSPAHKQLRDLGWTAHLDKSRDSRKAKAEAKAQRERERQAKPKSPKAKAAWTVAGGNPKAKSEDAA